MRVRWLRLVLLLALIGGAAALRRRVLSLREEATGPPVGANPWPPVPAPVTEPAAPTPAETAPPAKPAPEPAEPTENAERAKAAVAAPEPAEPAPRQRPASRGRPRRPTADAPLEAVRERLAAIDIPPPPPPPPTTRKRQRAEKAAKADKTAEGAPAWVEPTAGSCPAEHPIKAKLSSRLFHLPGMMAYGRTNADRCYSSAAEAERDGFTRARR